MKELKVNVLFRFSKKTGKVDIQMTGLGDAQMKLWALNNTPKTKSCMIIERDTGEVIFMTTGTEDDFPKVIDNKKKLIGMCDDFGIPFEVIKGIRDDRFDN